MVFDSVAHFPYFNKLKNNKNKLVQELENENGGGNFMDDTSKKNGLNIDKSERKNKPKCSC